MSEVDKSVIRTELLNRRRALSTEARQKYSSAIQQELFTQLDRNGIRHALVYRSMSDEVSTDLLLNTLETRALYAPQTLHADQMEWRRITPDTEWQRGRFGIMEPQDGEIWKSSMRPTALICPMTGFDRRGNRLGMGLGCFDRWLSLHRSDIDMLIGLAFACQEWPDIPIEAHDIPLQLILTEREAISCPTP